jgi:4-amino-4-deoxy-L-arabinose transferase-like glycosyltransferase
VLDAKMTLAVANGPEPVALARGGTVGTGRRALLLAAVLFLCLGVGVFDHDVWSPTEPTVAGVVTGMVRTGDLAVPRIHGLPYLEKPPLYYSLAWLCARLAGRLDAGVLRLPSTFFGLGSLALLWWTSRRFHGEAVAWACALLGATCFSLCEVFHRACTDSAAIFFAFLGFSLFAGSLHPETAADPGRVRLSDLLLALALALSFYAKNFYTVLVVLPPVAVFLLWKRRTRRLLRILLALGVLLLLAVGPWAVAIFREGGWPYLRVAFVDNTLGRFFDLEDFGRRWEGPLNDAYQSEKTYSPLVYLRALVYLPAPWTPLLAAAVLRLRSAGRTSELRSFLQLAWVTVTLVLCLSTSKVGLYLAPVLWVFLLAGGEWLAEPSPRRSDILLLRANLAFFWLVLFAAPVVAWRILADPWQLAALVPALAIATALLLRRGRGEGRALRLATHAAALAAGCAFVLAAVLPAANAERSYRNFFETVRPELEGRELCTVLRDDLRLPLLEYYVDRPFAILDSTRAGIEKLRGPDRVGLFLPVVEFEASQAALSAVSHRVLRGSQGKQPIVLVVNR